MEELPEALSRALLRIGVLEADQPHLAFPLTGGVSSDIWKVETPERTLCIKRALPKLKVQQDWFAPVERNRYEHRWYEIARDTVPHSAPRILAFDDEALLFVMEYLPPETHRLWKAELLAGKVDPEFAAQVGETLGRIHQRTAGDAEVARMFNTGKYFEQLRLEPYLRATATRHPALATSLHRLADQTARNQRALVHGDVSPKNLMSGPSGPVFLDAECAWYGDPAFDVAFCLNHLMLKRAVIPEALDALRESSHQLCERYFREATWEPVEQLEARVAQLLPALFLARVDGKSPVEYITDEPARERVRATAIPLIRKPVNTLSEVFRFWEERGA